MGHSSCSGYPRRAGGSVKEINGEDLKYGKINVLNPFFIAKSNFIHL